jgi:hypothetical protein
MNIKTHYPPGGNTGYSGDLNEANSPRNSVYGNPDAFASHDFEYSKKMRDCPCSDICAKDSRIPRYHPGIPTRARTLSMDGYDKKAYCSIMTVNCDEMYIATQVQMQPPLHSGDSILFAGPVFSNTNAIIHQSGSARFIVNELGIYEITYELDYDQSNVGDTIFQLSCFLPSRHVESITCVPAQGRICKTTKLLLAPGTVISVFFPGTTQGGVDVVSAENAVITFKKLYSMTLDLPPNPCCNTKDVCRDWLFQYSLTDAILGTVSQQASEDAKKEG